MSYHIVFVLWFINSVIHALYDIMLSYAVFSFIVDHIMSCYCMLQYILSYPFIGAYCAKAV